MYKACSPGPGSREDVLEIYKEMSKMLVIMYFISRSFIWLFLLPFFFDLSFLTDSLPFFSLCLAVGIVF